ncbi:hypothetical protein ACIPXW_35355, partial [Streptomyces sp. NPDC090056]
MTDPKAVPASAPESGEVSEADRLRVLLRTAAYLKALLFSALIGVPVSLAAFWFLVGLHQLEHVLWADLPKALGLGAPPAWWPLPLLAVAAIFGNPLVAAVLLIEVAGVGGPQLFVVMLP